MITAKALNNIMNEPEEMKLAIEEMIKFEEYYKKDLSELVYSEDLLALL